MNDLKQKTISGFIYKFMERAGAQGIKLVVSLILARILLPEEFGLVALVSVIITLCDVFVTYGFGNSLIADKESDSIDFSTCLYFGILLSLIIYGLIFYSAPVIAKIYGMDDLTVVLRVMGIRLPLAAINSVQHAYVSKHMLFKKFFYSTLIGTIVSGCIAIIMAFYGFGVWALVMQNLGNVCIDTICLWVTVKWRPIKAFSFHRLKKIYSYGWKILAVGLIDTGYNQLRSLLIGKKYTSADLAYYNKGNDFPATGMQLIEPTVNGVLFPALSQCRDDKIEMRAVTRKVIKVSTYIIFPIMLGLFSVAETLVTVLLTEKWLPCVVYLQIGCIANLFRPLQFINNCVIKASGRSGLLLKLDVVKKSFGLTLLILCMDRGVMCIAWSLVVVYFFSAIVNIAPNKKILDYGYAEQLKDIVGNMILSVLMCVPVYFCTYLPLHKLLLLVVQICVGMITYIILSILGKNESLFFLVDVVKQMYKKRKKNEKI